MRPSRHGAVAGLGRGRIVARLRLPRLDVRPRRRVHADPGQPWDQHPEQGADHALPRGRARRPDLGLPRRRRPGDAAARVPGVGRRRVSQDQDPAVRLALQRGAAGRELRRLQPLRVGPRGHPGRPREARDPRPRRDPRRDHARVRARDRGAGEPAQGRRRRGGPDPAQPEPLHDLDAVLGPPRPAPARRPPLRPVRRLVPAVGQGDPQLHLERAQLRAGAVARPGLRRLPAGDPRAGPGRRGVAASRGAADRPVRGAPHQGRRPRLDRLPPLAGRDRGGRVARDDELQVAQQLRPSARPTGRLRRVDGLALGRDAGRHAIPDFARVVRAARDRRRALASRRRTPRQSSRRGRRSRPSRPPGRSTGSRSGSPTRRVAPRACAPTRRSGCATSTSPAA